MTIYFGWNLATERALGDESASRQHVSKRLHNLVC